MESLSPCRCFSFKGYVETTKGGGPGEQKAEGLTMGHSSARVERKERRRGMKWEGLASPRPLRAFTMSASLPIIECLQVLN